MNIAVLEGYVNNPGDLSWDALESYGTVTVYDRTPRDQLAQRVAEAGIVVSSKTVWDAEALGWAPRLKMIALTSTGYNVVNLDAARARGIVVSYVPAYSTPETEHMMDAAALAKMKDGSYLLNTARGSLVDEQAVVDALRSGKLAGFGADVVSVEPMRPDNPLLQAKDENIVVTPHIAWATHEARERLLATVAANVGAFVDGHPQNVVD